MYERYNIAGQQAMGQGKFANAEEQFKLALQEAEQAGPKDPKLPSALNMLANCYKQQGKFAEAEPLYKRAIEVKERAVGPFAKDLIPLYDNYANLLRASGREAEAQKWEKKSRALFLAK